MTDAVGGARRGASRRSAPGRTGAAPARQRTTPGRSEGAGLVERLAPALAEAGYDLEDVTVGRAGRRSVVRVVVDRDAGIDLDAVADASRLVGTVLDADDEVLAGPYVLEVTSPGVDRPLTLPRHWRRATGRLVAVSLSDGRDVVGRVVGASADEARLRLAAAGELRVPYDEVTLAVVQVEFGGAKGEQPTDVTDHGTADEDAVDQDAVDQDATGDGLVDEDAVDEGTVDEDATGEDGPGPGGSAATSADRAKEGGRER